MNSETKDGKLPNSGSRITIQYTLAPLINDGRNCLACRDVEGMEAISLVGVEFYYGGSPWQKITRKSDDIFALVENDIFQWPALERITAARFQVRLRGDHRARQITIRPGPRSNPDRDETRLIIDDWMLKRKFMEMAGHDSKPVA